MQQFRRRHPLRTLSYLPHRDSTAAPHTLDVDRRKPSCSAAVAEVEPRDEIECRVLEGIYCLREGNHITVMEGGSWAKVHERESEAAVTRGGGGNGGNGGGEN